MFIPGPTENCFCGECRFMKKNTLEKAYDALLHMEPEITLPEEIRQAGRITDSPHARTEQVAAAQRAAMAIEVSRLYL